MRLQTVSVSFEVCFVSEVSSQHKFIKLKEVNEISNTTKECVIDTGALQDHILTGGSRATVFKYSMNSASESETPA